jgi:hypothetical protein
MERSESRAAARWTIRKYVCVFDVVSYVRTWSLSNFVQQYMVFMALKVFGGTIDFIGKHVYSCLKAQRRLNLRTCRFTLNISNQSLNTSDYLHTVHYSSLNITKERKGMGES